MGKPRAEKSGNLTKPNSTSKGLALSDYRPDDKPVLPSIFTQGKGEREVICKVGSDEAFKAIKESFGTENQHLWDLFFKQLVGCADSQTEAANNLNQLVPILYDIAPRDTIETMLAVQMVGIHNVAMDCLSRAQSERQTFEGRGANMKYATKLLETFTAQMESLQKYRGKGTQQKVTVEHVHVHQGGQAIVGAVSPQGRGDDDQS